jgi:RHH-type transcriptional regulator, rel operon repressor / antitoxin RelB
MARRISIRFDDKLRSRLERIARLTGRSKSFHIKQALVDQLPDLEDLQSARTIAQRVAVGRERVISLDQLEGELGRDA